jgi:hypothetical protein
MNEDRQRLLDELGPCVHRQEAHMPVCWIHDRSLIWDGLTWRCPESKRCPAAVRLTAEAHAATA